jgi:hypothetical protein
VYASRGTVVTRSFTSIPDFLGGIKIKRVWQSLVAGSTGKISASNGAFLDLPLLGVEACNYNHSASQTRQFLAQIMGLPQF